MEDVAAPHRAAGAWAGRRSPVRVCCPPLLAMRSSVVLLALGSGGPGGAAAAECPAAFPHPSAKQRGVLCYNDEADAADGSAPCGAWCTKDATVGDHSDARWPCPDPTNNQPYLCDNAEPECWFVDGELQGC